MFLEKLDARRHTFFDWVIHCITFKVGDQFKVVYTDDTPRTETGNITIYTKGLLTVSRDGGNVFDIVNRTPGLFSQQLRDAPAGTYTLTALQDSEWWCINYLSNRKQLPKVAPFRLLSGESISLPVPTKLMVCSGSYLVNNSHAAAPACYDVQTNSAMLTAETDCYGLYLLE